MDDSEEKAILEELKAYCEYYNIPLKHVVQVMSDVKVIPMIRGKGFEFIISDMLKTLLPQDKWDISNPNINAQSEVHDVDVYVTRKKDNRRVRIECKLSGKDSFRMNAGKPSVKVKCMRSRTLSDNEMATRMARRYGVSREMVLAHADNYREEDFDFVVTSLGNAFWNTKDNRYVFGGTEEQLKVLATLFPDRFSENDSEEDFKRKTFGFLLFANAKDLSVKPENKILCTRRRCISGATAKDCGFIPNYPMINLKDLSENKGAWMSIQNIEKVLKSF